MYVTNRGKGKGREGKGREGKEAVGEYIDTKKPKKNMKNIKTKNKNCPRSLWCILHRWIDIDRSISRS